MTHQESNENLEDILKH